MKKVLITEKQFKLGNLHLATTAQLDKMKEKLKSLEGLVKKDKIRAYVLSSFILGQLLTRSDTKDIYSREAIMREYDDIMQKVDEL